MVVCCPTPVNQERPSTAAFRSCARLTRPCLLLGEEGQQDLALFADQANEAVGFVALLALQVGIAHNHHLDRCVLQFGLGFRDCQTINVKGQVLDGWGPFLQGDQARRIMSRELLAARVFGFRNGAAVPL